jgi:hypothetical protein
LDGKPVTASLLLFENLLTRSELDALVADYAPDGLLANELKHEPTRFGKTLRKNQAYADNQQVVYRYAGLTTTNLPPMPASVQLLRSRILECLQANFGTFSAFDNDDIEDAFDDGRSSASNPVVVNSDKYMLGNFLQRAPNYCLVNFYPHGKSGIGKHADNASDMEPFAPIYSYSFGSERTFIIYDKNNDDTEITKVVMPVNSLIVMSGAMQSVYKHAVNPQTSVKTYRVNITYRYVPVDSKPESSKKRSKRN